MSEHLKGSIGTPLHFERVSKTKIPCNCNTCTHAKRATKTSSTLLCSVYNAPVSGKKKKCDRYVPTERNKEHIKDPNKERVNYVHLPDLKRLMNDPKRKKNVWYLVEPRPDRLYLLKDERILLCVDYDRTAHVGFFKDLQDQSKIIKITCREFTKIAKHEQRLENAVTENNTKNQT